MPNGSHGGGVGWSDIAQLRERIEALEALVPTIEVELHYVDRTGFRTSTSHFTRAMTNGSPPEFLFADVGFPRQRRKFMLTDMVIENGEKVINYEDVPPPDGVEEVS